MQGKMEINGVELNYRIDGPEGAPGVVMSNSWATDYTMWDVNMKALTAKYRVLRMDKRGHGGSGVKLLLRFSRTMLLAWPRRWVSLTAIL